MTKRLPGPVGFLILGIDDIKGFGEFLFESSNGIFFWAEQGSEFIFAYPGFETGNHEDWPSS